MASRESRGRFSIFVLSFYPLLGKVFIFNADDVMGNVVYREL